MLKERSWLVTGCPHLIFLYKPITGADLSYFIFRVLNKDRNGSDGATPSFFVARSKRALHWKSSTATLTEAGLIWLSDSASLFLLFRYRSSFSSPAGVQNRWRDIDQNHWCASNWKRSNLLDYSQLGTFRWRGHTAWQSVDIHLPWYTSTKRLEKENHFTDSNESHSAWTSQSNMDNGYQYDSARVELVYSTSC